MYLSTSFSKTKAHIPQSCGISGFVLLVVCASFSDLDSIYTLCLNPLPLKTSYSFIISRSDPALFSRRFPPFPHFKKYFPLPSHSSSSSLVYFRASPSFNKQPFHRVSPKNQNCKKHHPTVAPKNVTPCISLELKIQFLE